MVQYIKKRKLKNDNRFKYIYYKINGETRKRISSKEYYKNIKKKNYIGGNKYKGMSILQNEDNSPIDGSIKQITRVDKNLISFLSEHKLDYLFKRDKDIMIHGVPYVSYKMSPDTLEELEKLQEDLKNNPKYEGPQIFGNRVTYTERDMNKDMYIWNLEGEEDPDIDNTLEEYNILSKKSIEGKGLNPLTNKRYSEEYLKNKPTYYETLPVYIDRNHIRAVIENNQVTLIQSGTGSGKSVIVPKIALQIVNYGYGYTADIQRHQIRQQTEKLTEKLDKNHKVIMTLPKQVITRSAAEASARELDVTLGEIIGFKHSNSKIDDKRDSYDRKKTILLYATDGSLEHKLREYPTLRDESGQNLYDIIIMDEVHERNERIDMIIHLMKYALKHNPSLKLILMSATIDAKPFKIFFKNFKFQDISISGQPLKKIYEKWVKVPENQKYTDIAQNEIKTILENEISELDDEDTTNPEYERMKYVKGLYDNISNTDRENILRVQKQGNNKKDDEEDNENQEVDQEVDTKGSILFFVPGVGEAISMCNNITKFKDNLFLNTKIYCEGLSSKLIGKSKNNELEEFATHATAYKDSKGGPYGRKVIISTNVAESSLTIKGLSYVIDSGYENKNIYDPDRMIQALVEQRCSQAQARQRWGRVGRTEPGVAIRLYTKEEYENFQEYPDPDLINSNCIPLLLEITEMMEKKNKYSELLPEIYQNNYNIKSLENLMVKSTDFFVTPIKQNYFDNAKNILKKLECLDEEENFTLNFYLIREIFFIIKNIDNKASFTIFDAKMILESVVFDCVDEIIEIIVCCKYLRFGLANVFDHESDEQKKRKKIIKKKKLIKKYKKFIDEESDHLTILNLYQNYKQNPNPNKNKKMNIEVKAFSTTQEKLQHYSLIKIFMHTFKKICKDIKKSYPKSLEGLNSNDYLQKFQEIFLDKKNLKKNLEDYQNAISHTLKKITNEHKKIFEKQDIKIDLKAKSDDIDLMQIQKILKIILNKKNLPLKDQIISKLTQVFNNELQNDNNKVFKKITNTLYLIDKYEEDKNSINTKVLYALYQNNKLERHNKKDSNGVGLVEEGVDESDPSKDTRMRDINSKKEIIKQSNDVKTNIIRCILAGYSVHLCQNQKKKEEEEQEQVGGWWPFSSGKADMEITDENYINCFPKISTKLTNMFQENKDNTYVNFKNSNKKYIIYDTLTTKKNWKNPNKPHYMANIITIIPEEMVFEVKAISKNGECVVKERVR